ncbi:hypothetical protein K470DRAFT_293927 [Piedraia hortae CBS 480.64]|uniref:Uncharacterized protein n=1 Tax=Piedraia hortae CBS 480.64 TaxID=1314780 RepID=A0A6A7C370_9PEZI|nr:hypothetical protein K470DRAFT_293927 [Piedraia hortae CBS 480.64]
MNKLKFQLSKVNIAEPLWEIVRVVDGKPSETGSATDSTPAQLTLRRFQATCPTVYSSRVPVRNSPIFPRHTSKSKLPCTLLRDDMQQNSWVSATDKDADVIARAVTPGAPLRRSYASSYTCTHAITSSPLT